MESASIVKNTFRLNSAFHGDVSDQKLEESSDLIVPFPDWMTRKLANALPGTGVIGLVGESGSGKLTLLKQVSTIPVQEYPLMKRLNSDNLREVVGHLQLTDQGKCMHVVPAALLSEDLIRMMANRSWPTRIVLISNTKIYGLDNKNVFYHKGV